MLNATEIAKRLFLMLVALLVATGLAEVALRGYQRVAFRIGFFSAFPDFRVEPMVYSPFLAFGPRINYQIPDREHPELSRFDERGFRTTEPIGSKPAGELRIVALGGSTTEDLWNRSGRHWPWLLEQRLTAGGAGRVRVLNGGMSAYATPHTLIRTAFDVPELDADVLLVMHNINDLTAAYHAIAARTPLDGHYTAKYRLKSYTGVRRDEDVVWSRLWRLVSSHLEPQDTTTVILAEDEATLAEGVRLFQRNLASIAAVARAHGVRPVFLTMPFDTGAAHFRVMQSGQVRIGSVGIGQLPERERMMRDLARYNAATLSVSATIGVPAVDMAGAGAWPDSLFVDTVHLSDRGSEVFADRLAAALGPLLAGGAGAARVGVSGAGRGR